MYDFNTLIEEVLKKRQDVTKDKLLELISEKKKTVGAGYLTDQGALFLIAGELGVSLNHVTASDLTLKDLYMGASDITIVARVLAVYRTNEYAKKDGGIGKYRKLLLFDKNAIVRLTLWEDKTDEVERVGAHVDKPIRVVSGYVKQGLDGKPNLNLGKKGRIEVINDKDLLSKLPTSNELAKKVGEVNEAQQMVAVDGVISSEVKVSNFKRADGSSGSATHFRIKSFDGSKEMRIVIWDAHEEPKVQVGSKVRITNVKLKQQGMNEVELHGDSASAVLPIQNLKPSQTFRVVGVLTEGKKTYISAADGAKKVHTILLDSVKIPAPRLSQLLQVAPDSERDDLMICSSTDSVSPPPDGTSFPEMTSLCTKVNEIKSVEGPLMLEVIALSKDNTQEVTLKDGSRITKSEVTVGDDTGEVKLIAWRNQAQKLLGIELGERLRIVGVTAQTDKVGYLSTQLSRYSTVEKLRTV